MKSSTQNYLIKENNYKMKSNLWEFYFRYQINGFEHIADTRRCINPAKTKVYRTLKENFNQEFICSYGYRKVEIEKKIDTMTNKEIFLEFLNNFLTTQRMAEYYDITYEDMYNRIKQGKIDHNNNLY